MILEGLEVGPLAANCYIIGCEETREAAIVDPGSEAKHILDLLKKLDLNCKYIILTHGHGDHIGALKKVQEATSALVLIHAKDADMLTRPANFLFTGSLPKIKNADHLLKDGDIIQVGKIPVKVIHTPGHTPGGITLKVGDNLITGDTLFAGSIGRFDLPGGNYRQLIKSIKEKLLTFPPETKVLPGHGPASSIGIESKYNPFLIEQ